MKAPRMNYGVVELAALSALSALCCVVAAGRADLVFVALFGAASTIPRRYDVYAESDLAHGGMRQTSSASRFTSEGATPPLL
jgi:hypothetical protein